MQVLLQLAELGSVQRTADAIGMTQSSVTQTLAYLEGLLEVRLFERHARGVRPTPACTDLLPVARRLMLGIADSAEVVTARQQQGEGVVRMVGSVGAINGLLLDTLADFCDRFPATQVQLAEAEGDDQLLAIARGEVDLVVCRRPAVTPEGWEFLALRDDRFVVVARTGHPMACSRPLGWAELAEPTWLLLPAGVGARRRFDEFARQFPHPPRAYPVVTRSVAMLWRLLRQRPLLALLPLNLVRPLLDEGTLVELWSSEALTLEPIGILQPKAGVSNAAKRMSEFLRANQMLEP
ncbi:LysR family transcriptional regulator [Variovorax sp. J22G21]|uniref:LysR family transcriptional regulator n=1 Tax=Variovorax fucosicus TaxID=3053517 RepID=UPI002575AD3F|nr:MULTISPECIES: LysR family transcriptional regulator [unclassified Variovorax]MDM0041235.1 LysR family transcriptional regulator [Variovorax sp. J22R193]MDM0060292.1 LysR family transcriptional regulator [Variovorax sp. J22G21]